MGGMTARMSSMFVLISNTARWVTCGGAMSEGSRRMRMRMHHNAPSIRICRVPCMHDI
jgi:hypothetical protein